MECARRIKSQIITLQKVQPFFGYIATSLTLHEFPENVPIKTMGVDANFNLYYDEKWIDENVKDNQVLLGCVCHEVLHICLNHIGRLGTRLHTISNIAQDMVVNSICAQNNLKIVQGEGYVNVDNYKNKAWVDLKKLNLGTITVEQIS